MIFFSNFLSHFYIHQNVVFLGYTKNDVAKKQTSTRFPGDSTSTAVVSKAHMRTSILENIAGPHDQD
jgi:hypothetical protein